MEQHRKRRRFERHVVGALAGFFALAFAAPTRAQEQDSDTLPLRQAITLALQNSRDLKVARMQYTVAQNQVGVDRAAFLPNLYTGAGAAYTNGFPSVGGQAPAAFEVNYNQVLFNPLLKGDQHAAEEH